MVTAHTRKNDVGSMEIPYWQKLGGSLKFETVGEKEPIRSSSNSNPKTLGKRTKKAKKAKGTVYKVRSNKRNIVRNEINGIQGCCTMHNIALRKFY